MQLQLSENLIGRRNYIAIVGVMGNVETQARKLLDFPIRYTADFGLRPRHALYAAATESARDDGD